MGGKKSRDKGKRGERAARDACKKYWNSVNCIRGQQRSGKETADVVEALPCAHVEVKNYKRIVAIDFLRQAESDASEGQLPVVLMKEDRDSFVVMFRMKDSEEFAHQLATSLDKAIVPRSK